MTQGKYIRKTDLLLCNIKPFAIKRGNGNKQYDIVTSTLLLHLLFGQIFSSANSKKKNIDIVIGGVISIVLYSKGL